MRFPLEKEVEEAFHHIDEVCPFENIIKFHNLYLFSRQTALFSLKAKDGVEVQYPEN